MKATSQGSQFFSVGQASRYLSVSPSQIRLMVDRGELEAFTLASGHRRISAKSIKAFANGTTVEDLAGCNGGEKKVVGYARCSSNGQKESLIRQIQRLTNHISTTYDIPANKVEIRQEICSSFSGNRKAFFELCDDITDGKVSVVVSEFKNRFSRVPCQLRLLEHIADRQGCSLVFLDTEENENEEKANMLELVDYIQHLSAKSAGRKSALVTTVHLKAETVTRIAELSNQGMTQRQIAKIIEEEGHLTEKGEKISRSKIRQFILLNGTVKTIVGIDKDSQTSLNALLTKWVAENIIPCENSRLTVKEIGTRFNSWMTANGKATVRPTVVGKWLTQVCKLPNKMVSGYRYFLNVGLA